MNPKGFGSLLPAFALFASLALGASEWPQYRGSNHDGISTETIRTNWSQEAPRPVWRIGIDPGLSSFAISGGKAFTLARRSIGGQEQEVCLALNADTGAELWASPPLGIADYPDDGVGADDGPRSTPSVDNGYVYVLTSYLGLYCLNSTNGAVIWSKNLVTEYGSSVIAWQSAASPLVDGDLVFVICSSANKCLLAFHKADGTEAWKGQNDAMTQASPIAVTIGGTRQIIFFAQSGLVAVAPDTGTVIWRYQFPFTISTAASPVLGSNIVYCSATYGVGAGAVRVTGSAGQITASQIWRTAGGNMNHWATPVYRDGYLYGVYGESATTLRCIDLATGSSKWQQGGVGLGEVLIVSGQVLALTGNGYLVLVKPDPTSYQEIARFRALDGSKSSSSFPQLVRCWNVPAISNGRIYVRSTTEAVALDVSVAPPPALKLASIGSAGGESFRLLVGNENGSPLDTNRVARIDVLASSDLALGLSGWLKLTNTTILTNGQLLLDDPQSATTPRRFFKVEEQP